MHDFWTMRAWFTSLRSRDSVLMCWRRAIKVIPSRRVWRASRGSRWVVWFTTGIACSQFLNFLLAISITTTCCCSYHYRFIDARFCQTAHVDATLNSAVFKAAIIFSLIARITKWSALDCTWSHSNPISFSPSAMPPQWTKVKCKMRRTGTRKIEVYGEISPLIGFLACATILATLWCWQRRTTSSTNFRVNWWVGWANMRC